MLEWQLSETLGHLGIPIRTPAEGKNVSPGWLGIDCPSCADRNKHLGVRVDDLFCSCWRCDLHGHLFGILQEHFDISWGTIKRVFGSGRMEKPDQKVSDYVLEILNGKVEHSGESEDVRLPSGAHPITERIHFPLLDLFLQRRGYTRKDCMASGAFVARTGLFSCRIILPILQGQKIIAYQGRGLAERMIPKYLSIGLTSSCLYGLDDCDLTKPLFLVEGVFDKWRLGAQAICSFGKKLSLVQRRLLAEVKPSLLYLLWDSDAFWNCRLIKDELSAYGIEAVHVILPDGEDPDSLGLEKTKQLIDETRRESNDFSRGTPQGSFQNEGSSAFDADPNQAI